MTDRRVTSAGHWTLSLPADFEEINNGDSWQAVANDRIVYISAIGAKGKDGLLIPAETLCATAGRALDPTREQHRFSTPPLAGVAQLTREDGHSQLMGFVCAAGTVATCVVNFDNESDSEWALTTWRSLRHP